MTGTGDEPVRGDLLGLPVPADAAALQAAGIDGLTALFRAFGTLAPDQRVARIVRFEPFHGGGTGAKLQLSLAYEGAGAAPPADLFVKFSRNFDDPIRDATRHHMEPEVRLALLSRASAFPIAVPRCLYAEFHRDSGTGILVTERIAYGADGIEPHYPKCLDHHLPDAPGHYRALVTAIARLAGTHKAGLLPDDVADHFPFDRPRALTADRLPVPDKLRHKIDRLVQFAGDYPQLFDSALRDPAFLARFADEGLAFQRHEDAIKRYLHDDPDLIALCHWNANVDNAWFWRMPDGTLACGLMDWGSVGQMSVAMTLWGCLSGAEPALWDDQLERLLTLFAATFADAGGPRIDGTVLRRHFTLYVAMMGLAYLLDAPARILRELPDLASVDGPLDPRFSASETARVQRSMLVHVLGLFHRGDVADAMRAIVP